MSVRVREASSAEDYAAFAALIVEYEAWLRERYSGVPELVATMHAHQDLDAELAALPGKYGPPTGVVLLAEHEGAVVGGVAYRDLHDRTCEMKRLFVRATAHGSGTGRLLCERLIETATRAGYEAMRLDTGTGNTEALALYRDLGFVERTPYAHNPPEVLPYLLFLERPLAL